MDSLFDPFTQADPSITRRFGGTGLGLSICKQICEAMGGEMNVISTPGIGACFSFTIPLAIVDSAPPANRIQVHAINIDSLLHPVLDSLALTRGMFIEWTEEEGAASEILLKGVGSEITGKIPGKSLDNVLTPNRLWRRLSNSQATVCKVGGENSEHVRSNLRILVAEDVVANQIVIRMMLKQLGYNKVTVVGNGSLALEKVSDEVFDIAIFDIHMPVMDGITAAREIRANPNIEQPILIAASADVTTDAKRIVEEVGINEWLPKPFNRTNLEKVLCRISKSITGDAA